MSSTSQIVLTHVLRLMRPVVRLLLRNGVTFTTFAAALKQVFVDVARLELAEQRMPQTDSAVTLLSGVHRRDVRQLTREAADSPLRPKEPLSLAAQVVARWMNEPGFVDAGGAPRPLPRGPEPGGFDELVAGVSRDVRPKAMLDELVRLGVVDLDGATATASVQDSSSLWLRATVLLASQLAGNASATAAQSVEYAKDREQFGKPIGSFQAVKHRCADMAVLADAATSLSRYASLTVADSRPDAAFHAQAAWTIAARAAVTNAQVNVQNHGGIGFTWEHTAHRYVTRAQFLVRTLGNRADHLDALLAEPAPA